MKVLYFHQHFSTPKGSAGTRSYEFSKALIRKGHFVTVVCGRYSGASSGLSGSFERGIRSGEVDGINVIELDLHYSNSHNFIQRGLIFFKYAIKCIKIALSESYDLVYATSTPLTAGIPGMAARWIKRKPFIFEVRDLWPELPKAMGVITNPLIIFLLKVLERAIYYSAHHIIALSPGISRGIESEGIDSNKITFIPNGCDLDIFQNIFNPWRPEKIQETDLLLLYAGTHGIANGLMAIMEAALELQNRGVIGIKFLLVGQGMEKNKLIQFSTQHELENVIFHEPIDKEQLSGLMASADVGLQVLANVPAFYYGTSPNKFFDYISAGLPVLNNYPGWISEIITDNNCGYTINPDSPTNFADIVEMINNNRQDLVDKGQNSKLIAAQSFNRNDLSNEWVDRLERLTSNLS